jgi:hypothetical protein
MTTYRTASWVVVQKDTGKAILETFDPKMVAAINLDRYRVIPILEYLTTLNRQIQENAA